LRIAFCTGAMHTVAHFGVAVNSSPASLTETLPLPAVAMSTAIALAHRCAAVAPGVRVFARTHVVDTCAMLRACVWAHLGGTVETGVAGGALTCAIGAHSHPPTRVGALALVALQSTPPNKALTAASVLTVSVATAQALGGIHTALAR